MGQGLRSHQECFSLLERKFQAQDIDFIAIYGFQSFSTFPIFCVRRLFFFANRSFSQDLRNEHVDFTNLCKKFDSFSEREKLLNLVICCYKACSLCHTNSSSLVTSCQAYPSKRFPPSPSSCQPSSASPVPKSPTFFSKSQNSYRDVEDVEVVELPRDVVDSPEDIELPLEVLHGVSVALWRHVAFAFEFVVLEIGQAELPQVLHPVFGVLASENVGALAVGRRRTAASWQRDTVILYID